MSIVLNPYSKYSILFFDVRMTSSATEQSEAVSLTPKPDSEMILDLLTLSLLRLHSSEVQGCKDF